MYTINRVHGNLCHPSFAAQCPMIGRGPKNPGDSPVFPDVLLRVSVLRQPYKSYVEEDHSYGYHRYSRIKEAHFFLLVPFKIKIPLESSGGIFIRTHGSPGD